MPRLNLKIKKIITATLFLAVVFGGVMIPVNYSAVTNTNNYSQSVISTANAQTQPPVETTGANGCGTFNIFCNLEYFVNNTLPAIISGIILTITAWFLGIAGLLLNTVISFTVVNMAANINGVTGINIAWKVMRDLANLGFIFILLYIAIGTILRLSSVNMKKMLVNVVIIALLLNFSLFFTKIIIDGSNILTIGFYNKIATGGTAGQPSVSGLSGAFMDRLGVSSVYGLPVSTGLDTGDAGKTLLTGLFGGILFSVAGFVFLAGAFMFIIRYVTLIFLLIFSPLAFAAMALPNDKYSSKWWSKLWDNVIFAPVFMIITWATITVLDGILAPGGVGGGATSLAGAATSQALPATGVLEMVMNFIIVIVMMVATLVVSKELGAAGAAGAVKMGKKWAGETTGFLARGTVRASGIKAIDKKLFDNSFGQTTLVGRALRSATTGAALDAKFGSSTSVSKTDKEFKKYREDFAKKKSENVTKEHDKREMDRQNSAAILLNSGSRPEDRSAAHLKLYKNEKARLEDLDGAYENAMARKAYAEADEIKAMRDPLKLKVDKMKIRQDNWDSVIASGDLKNNDNAVRQRAKSSFVLSNDQATEIVGDTKEDNEKLRIKMAQRIEATKMEKGNAAGRLARNIGGKISTGKGAALVGGAAGLVAAGPLGVPVGMGIGAAAGTKTGKKWIGNVKKFVYGEGESARKTMIKKYREDARKGNKGGGDLEAKLKQLMSDSGIASGDEGGGGDSGGGGTKKT